MPQDRHERVAEDKSEHETQGDNAPGECSDVSGPEGALQQAGGDQRRDQANAAHQHKRRSDDGKRGAGALR